MARPYTIAASPPRPSLTAAPSILFFLLVTSSSSSPASPSAGAESDAATSPLQHPTLSVSLSLSVSEEIKANPFDFISLPHQRSEQELLRPHEEPGEPERLREGASPQKEEEKGSAGESGAKCSYTVIIKTSCSSPRVTRDAVSLAFGDAYHNEVYAARMDDPASGTFERCSIDTFRVVGPCGGRTCYLYLRRSGRDGWTPEYVKVLYRPDDSRASVTFFYKSPLPNNVWYGFNLCQTSAARGSIVTAVPAAAAAAITTIGGMRLGDIGSDDGSTATTGEILRN